MKVITLNQLFEFCESLLGENDINIRIWVSYVIFLFFISKIEHAIITGLINFNEFMVFFFAFKFLKFFDMHDSSRKT